MADIPLIAMLSKGGGLAKRVGRQKGADWKSRPLSQDRAAWRRGFARRPPLFFFEAEPSACKPAQRGHDQQEEVAHEIGIRVPKEQIDEHRDQHAAKSAHQRGFHPFAHLADDPHEGKAQRQCGDQPDPDGPKPRHAKDIFAAKRDQDQDKDRDQPQQGETLA